MSDEQKKRSRGWIWLAPAAAPLLYLLSLFPALFVGAWLAEFGIVSDRHAASTLNLIYAPILWECDRSERFKTGLTRIGQIGNPLMPKRFRR